MMALTGVYAGIGMLMAAGFYFAMIRPLSRFYRGFFGIQQRAYGNPFTQGPFGFHSRDGLILAYSIVADSGSYRHQLEGITPGKPQSFLIKKMIPVLNKLRNNFKQAGLGKGPSLDFKEGAGGSHVITFTLGEESHHHMKRIFKKKTKIRKTAKKPAKARKPIEPLPPIR